ncbi:MAG: phosphonopyruvate decarboxylase [Gammaproteobacteria bacterium]
MIAAQRFLHEASERGFDFYTGVPCSFLTPLINRVISDQSTTYVGAASEGEAVGIASGAWLAGRETVVMCQNSGLGNTVNPLTSLNVPFRIPTLLIVTWRGGPGVSDEPQHELMGEITPSVLDVLRIPYQRFPVADVAIGPCLDEALERMRSRGISSALIMEKGSVGDEPLLAQTIVSHRPGEVVERRTGGRVPTRESVLRAVLDAIPPTTAVVATTGMTGRELFSISDRAQHFYQVGSMGCASAMGLGIALNTAKPVLVLDGDGAALMKLGTMATIGAQQPENLTHIVLDNGVHDSTGGQPTVSPGVDFAGVASACGYASATRCDGSAGVAQRVHDTASLPGPHLIHARIAPGSMDNLGRPTITPPAVAARFRAFVCGEID